MIAMVTGTGGTVQCSNTVGKWDNAMAQSGLCDNETMMRPCKNRTLFLFFEYWIMAVSYTHLTLPTKA